MSRRAAILGLGSRGASWAETCTDAGWDVRAFDSDPAVSQDLSKLPGYRRVSTISSAVRKADWVFCCLPERLELVQMMMRRALAEAPRSAVVAVASQTYDVEALQSCTIRPGQIFRLGETEEGGVALGLSERNDPETIRFVEQAFAELAAVRSLRPVMCQVDEPDDAKSA